MKKRLFSLMLVLCLCMGLTVPALAYGNTARAGQSNPVSAGNVNIGVIDASGSLWMWGWNEAGQVGNGGGGDSTYRSNMGQTYPFQTTPVKVMDGVVSVSCGINHTAAIKADGSLWMWGSNKVGQLGNNGVGNSTYDEIVRPYPVSTESYVCQTVPLKVMDNVSAVSCGNGYTAVIRTDGSLWMWGDNQNGQLGNGTTEMSKSPLKIMDNVSVVSCGYTATAIVKTDGSLWTWGDGYLGNGEYMQSSDPVKVMDNAKDVSCSYNLIAAVKTDGTLWAWGGVTGNPYDKSSLVPIQKGSDAVSVTCGRDFSAVITTNGSQNLKMWGNDNYGQCGGNRSGLVGLVSFGGADTGIKIYYCPTPALVRVVEDVVAVSCGLDYTVAITSDAKVWVWGSNDDGQLGDASISNDTDQYVPIQTIPVQLTSLTGMTSTSFTPSGTSNTPIISTVGNFSDVLAGEYYAGPVQWAVEKGIASGTSATTFSPNEACTNAQILTFLWRAYGSPEPTINNPFTNVKSNDFYYKPALWAYENGMISGSTFNASVKCTRAMAVMYIWQAAGSPRQILYPPFYDVDRGGPTYTAVSWAVTNKITSGTGDYTFSPDEWCTRGQIVTFLYRAMGQ